MKLFKLIVHQKNFSGEDLIINPKDHPQAKKGDIVEIYHPEDEFSRLLLQITSFKEDFQGKDIISVEQSIATTFQLRTYADVYMNIVKPEDVALDSVELTFKDQYLGRSEMWRLKNSLVNTCVYLNKKIEFCGGAVRCQVYEMWSMGDRVACGVITDDTKVVFRSSTSMVYLFLQMSSEMWDFDIHGDLYFEKAVNGFLADLFQKWKKNGSNHEVTIVLFSRTFYKSKNLDDFPAYMHECLQQDYRGRYYEDFYRVAVQNERYEDWTSVLVQLRRLFTDYQKIVLEYHKRSGFKVPKAVNSTAAQGNFLEVLNMSLNVFEKHYLDRSFDRTGQLSVVITPGVGVFEVDRELTNVTKQRIIDNGVGSDLVCVGEQPLHAVPLLKFHNKDSLVSAADDYSMPHWINLSFYSTNKKVAYSNFIPRIKLPPKRSKPLPVTITGIIQPSKSKLIEEDECMPNSLFDYDAYDAQVFQLPAVHVTRFSQSLQRMNSRNKKSGNPVEVHNNPGQKILRRKMSDPDIHHTSSDQVMNFGSSTPRSAAISIPQNHTSEISPQQSASISASHGESLKQRVFGVFHEAPEIGCSPPIRPIVGSAGSPSSTLQPSQYSLLRPGRALINPFDPSHVTIKLTSNRRRWTHIFPKGPTGVLIQQHHYQAVPTGSNTEHISGTCSTLSSSPGNEIIVPVGSMPRSASQVTFQENIKYRSTTRPSLLPSSSNENPIQTNKSLTFLWGATGEQEWTPALTTGVDWKSLTIPACLPITTDYFPDKRSLQNDYLVSDYNLLPDDVNADFAQQRAIYKKPLTTPEVFRELISQRLAQGFQLIILSPSESNNQIQTSGITSLSTPNGVSSVVMTRHCDMEPTQQYLLSIGRVFHKISLNGSSITVTRYRPRHPYPPFNIHYQYRFQAPHHDTYEVSWVYFTTEKLENYNWNYMDHYICTRGDVDFALAESLKYWRFRIYLLPLNHSATRKILEGAEHCDIYTAYTVEEQSHHVDGFLRFIETWINRIRRPNTYKKPRQLSPVFSGTKTTLHRRHSTSLITFTHSSNSVSSSTNSQQEMHSSNRMADRSQSRSGSKVMERVKAEGNTHSGRISPANETLSCQFSATENISSETLALQDAIDDSVITNTAQAEVCYLKSSATLSEIRDAMRNPQTNVGFLTHHASLPSNTFVSADAVQWLISHVEGIDNEEQAIVTMENLRREKMVCHASGDFTHPFLVGFYLYHIVQQECDADYLQPRGDFASFENEWLEVEVKHPNSWKQDYPSNSSSVPNFLSSTLEELCEEENEREGTVPLYKHIHLEIDVNTKSDRIEWGHARYQSVYKPTHAYELVVQWVAASGTIVAELVQGWSRKAQTCGLQMIPIPADPLALPFTHKSDPLRGPIFIPLDIECLMGNKSYLFEEFPESSWDQRLFHFQENILQQFGFMRCTVESPRTNAPNNISHNHQFIHLTGNVFILIPSQPCQVNHQRRSSVSKRSVGMSKSLGIQGNRRYPVNSDVVSSPHEEYITRHVSGKNKGAYGPERKTGFLWSWNYMVSRRWKSSSTPATGDEIFQTKLLKDFREFCANNNNRLKNFWNSCWMKKQESVQM